MKGMISRPDDFPFLHQAWIILCFSPQGAKPIKHVRPVVRLPQCRFSGSYACELLESPGLNSSQPHTKGPFMGRWALSKLSIANPFHLDLSAHLKPQVIFLRIFYLYFFSRVDQDYWFSPWFPLIAAIESSCGEEPPSLSIWSDVRQHQSRLKARDGGRDIFAAFSQALDFRLETSAA